MKKSKGSKQLPQRAGALALALILVSFAFGMNGEVGSRVAPSPSWSLATTFLANRVRYRSASGRDDGIRQWSEYTPAYFRALTARRASIMHWAAGLRVPPTIVFVGQIHIDIAGGSSPEEIAEIGRIQGEIFDRVSAQAVDASVIATEDAGSDEVLTPEIMMENVRRGVLEMEGIPLSDEEIRYIMYHDPQPATRAVLELSTPVIDGEEWPIMLETHLLRRGPPPDPEASATLGELIAHLNDLRSEIILIRTLEFLRRHGGNRGIIVQGDAHRPAVEALAASYHISFVGIPVE